MERCSGCGFRPLHCMCDQLQVLPVKTHIWVIRHFTERFKASNTGGLLTHLLPNARLIDYGERDNPFDPAQIAGDNRVLLYPGGSEGPLPPHPILILLDGTWHQARRMYKKIPGIAGLPRLNLPPPPPRLRMRIAPNPLAMSTLEAAALAIAQLEGPEPAEILLNIYDTMTTRQLLMRGQLSP